MNTVSFGLRRLRKRLRRAWERCWTRAFWMLFRAWKFAPRTARDWRFERRMESQTRVESAQPVGGGDPRRVIWSYR